MHWSPKHFSSDIRNWNFLHTIPAFGSKIFRRRRKKRWQLFVTEHPWPFQGFTIRVSTAPWSRDVRPRRPIALLHWKSVSLYQLTNALRATIRGILQHEERREWLGFSQLLQHRKTHVVLFLTSTYGRIAAAMTTENFPQNSLFELHNIALTHSRKCTARKSQQKILDNSSSWWYGDTRIETAWCVAPIWLGTTLQLNIQSRFAH